MLRHISPLVNSNSAVLYLYCLCGAGSPQKILNKKTNYKKKTNVNTLFKCWLPKTKAKSKNNGSLFFWSGHRDKMYCALDCKETFDKNTSLNPNKSEIRLTE